jgi:transcriptional regulator of arginine metabolism
MSAVGDRRRVILEAIAIRTIETQEQMVAALAERGIEASQASVSRDITALRLVKVDGRWTAPPRERSPDITMEERIAGRLISVAPAGDHLIVLTTPPGEAGGVALALDGLQLEDVVGTVAGDDTIFIAMIDAQAGRRLTERLHELIAG